MAQLSGSLLAVSVVNPNGTISHHSNKAVMEAACLEEAKACFTQANDTPFLLPPLILELGLLNCDKPHFDAIASGQYHPPEGTYPGTQLLLQHLKQPVEVPECKL